MDITVDYLEKERKKEMHKIIGQYLNGNYKVTIFSDGTKIRENELDSLIPDFPESIDMKITDYCDLNCPFCHENSTVGGKHANLNDKWDMLSTVHPYTELAIGGGNPLSHPQLENLLEYCKDKNILCNITVNIKHFLQHYEYIKELSDKTLIRGLGISVNNITQEQIAKIKSFKNAVIHTIAGINSIDDYKIMSENQLKVLILGYKNYRRGSTYKENNSSVEENIQILKQSLPLFWDGFKIISFDNLALTQLDVKSILNKNTWDQFYMGNDGEYTFYIDLVNEKFARNSTSELLFDLGGNITEMFKQVH